MNRRLRQFLDLENLSPAQLADILGVQRSGMSHILSGRNKPSYDFINNVLTKFPQLSADWFLTGKGKPYKEMNNYSAPAYENPITPIQVVASPTQLQTLTATPAQLQTQATDSTPTQEQCQIFTQAEKSVHDDGDLFSFDEINAQNTKNREAQSENWQNKNFSSNIPNDEKLAYHVENKSVTRDFKLEQPHENQKNAPEWTDGSKKRSVKQVIIFYNDGSFEEFHP